MVVMGCLKGLASILCFMAVTSLQVLFPELERLEEFIELSKNNLGGEYVNRTSGCIQSHILHYGDRGSPRRSCKKIAATVVKDLGIVRTTSTVENTCQYSIASARLVNLFPLQLSPHIVEVRVKQFNCSDGWTPALGKSFFRLTLDQTYTDNANEELAATSECRFTNSVENAYHCPIRNQESANYPLGRECSALCNLKATAVLDYEHYSAFDEVVGLTYGLNKVVVSQPLPPVVLSDEDTKSKKRHAKSSKVRCCAMKHDSEIKGKSPQNPPAPPVSQRLHDSQNTTVIRAALGKLDAVYFIGASHMRYLWDTVVHRHYNASALLTSLPQHHADEKVENLWFVNNYFSMELPALLKDICTPDSPFVPPTATASTSAGSKHSDSPKAKVVLVIQTGSWDLDFNPAQNILLFPNSSTAVVQALVNMTTLNDDLEAVTLCNGRQVEVVWLTSVPIPECEETINSGSTNVKSHGDSSSTPVYMKRHNSGAKREKTCFDKGYRNNYAIQAINQYFVREFENAMYPGVAGRLPSKAIAKTNSMNKSHRRLPHLISSLNLQIIDAFGIIYPHRNDNVCGLHYLCCKHYRKERVEILSSPGGEKLVDNVLQTLLRLAGW